MGQHDLFDVEAALRARDLADFVATPDVSAAEAARRRQARLTKPPGSLGRLEDLACFLAAVWGTERLPVEPRRLAVLFAADHGVAAKGVSAYPQEVTRQMVENFARGGAAANVLSRHCGAELIVVDVGVKGPRFGPPIVDAKIAPGTADMTEGPAMSFDRAVESVMVGIRLAASVAGKKAHYELLGGEQAPARARGGTLERAQLGSGLALAAVGEMGIANTTAASAVTAAVLGADPATVTGSGTGIDEERRIQKVAVVRRALEVNGPDPHDPLDVLAKVGGFEIGAIAGFCIGCAIYRIPLVLDGFITASGALLAKQLAPGAEQFWVAGHKSVEPGHGAALDFLALAPLLDLDMRLGEGSGALVAMNVLLAAVRTHEQMATFEEAGVSEKESEGSTVSAGGGFGDTENGREDGQAESPPTDLGSGS